MSFLIQIFIFIMFFYLIRYILGALLPAVLSQGKFRTPGPQKHSRDQGVKYGKMEKDPVCGTYVDTATSPHATFAGETRYFCSSNCLDKFKEQRG
jgi:YHS domain-containing protein